MSPTDALPSDPVRGPVAMSASAPRPGPRRFLFLQGPISPFFSEVAAGLSARGHAVHRINLCLGDKLFWRHVPGAPKPVDFTARPKAWPGFIEAFLDQHGITDLVLLGEQRTYHRVAITTARQRGIAVTVTDFGYFRPDWITLERDGMGGDSRFPRDPDQILALARDLPPAELHEIHTDDFGRQARWDVLYHVANLTLWPFSHYDSHQLHHPLATYWGIGRRLLRRQTEREEGARALTAIRDRPFWVFAMQMETDFSVRAYSRFPDLDTPIAETLRSFAARAPAEAQMLVKVHPLDPCLKRWDRRIADMAKAAGLTGRVHVAHHGPMEAMLAAARGLVTINSTVGIKAVAMGCPVKALGKAVWDVPGLAHQGSLDAFWQHGVPPEPRLRDAFLAALQASTQLRGVFYGDAGRAAAVDATVEALHRDSVGALLPVPPPIIPGFPPLR